MKKFLLALLCAVCAAPAFAQAPDGWLTDYEKALETARREKKHVYVLFTGSDWCPWCVKLRREVLERPEFKQFAAKHLVPVYCDFPRNNPPPAEQLDRQRKWSRELQAGRGVPSAVIVDPDGKVTGRVGGFAEPKIYLEKLRSAVK